MPSIPTVIVPSRLVFQRSLVGQVTQVEPVLLFPALLLYPPAHTLEEQGEVRAHRRSRSQPRDGDREPCARHRVRLAPGVACAPGSRAQSPRGTPQGTAAEPAPARRPPRPARRDRRAGTP